MAKKEKEVIEYKSYYAKGTAWNQSPIYEYRYMECKKCGAYSTCGDDATAVTCNICAMEGVEPPVLKQKNKGAKRPKGWHFMAEYVDADGNVYHKGVEQPDLYGTLETTVIVPKKRVSKKDKQKYKYLAATKVSILKKELAKTRWKKDKKVILKSIRYFTRIMNGKLPTGYLERLYEK